SLVVAGPVNGAAVRVDGHLVGATPYRGSHPVGWHVVEVRAPTSQADHLGMYRQRVVVPVNGEVRVVPHFLPRLTQPLPEPTSSAESRRWLRRSAWITAAAGVAAAGAAVWFGLVAVNRKDEADAFAKMADASSAVDQSTHRHLVERSESMVTAAN